MRCGGRTSQVTAWQNQFDEIILNVARDTGVPAHLLKNMFAIESQFWPGASNKTDIGLGQLTPEGADTTLMWNPPFFTSLPAGHGLGGVQQGVPGSDR